MYALLFQFYVLIGDQWCQIGKDSDRQSTGGKARIRTKDY
jgi:hypothetical protein